MNLRRFKRVEKGAQQAKEASVLVKSLDEAFDADLEEIQSVIENADNATKKKIRLRGLKEGI